MQGAAKNLVGAALAAQGLTAEGESRLVSGAELLLQRAAPPWRVHDALSRVVEFYQATGRPEGAARWRERLNEYSGASGAMVSLPEAR